MTVMWSLSATRRKFAQSSIFALLCAAACSAQPLREPVRCIFPEQRRIQYRSPGQLPPLNVVPGTTPPTVTDPQTENQQEAGLISLDEALRIALRNSEVIRVLAGTTAVSTGQTLYDPAITNTQVDQARGAFDPNLRLQNNYNHDESPGFADVDTYNLGLTVDQQKASGGTVQFGVTAAPTRRNQTGLPLNPQTPTAVEFSYTQPLLRGRGRDVNLAPIVIARIDTERSFYLLKDAVQDLVRSVIEGYWGLVFARTDVWARQQQVEQFEFAVDFLLAQQRVGRGDAGDTAQSQVSLARFRESDRGASRCARSRSRFSERARFAAQ